MDIFTVIVSLDIDRNNLKGLLMLTVENAMIALTGNNLFINIKTFATL